MPKAILHAALILSVIFIYFAWCTYVASMMICYDCSHEKNIIIEFETLLESLIFILCTSHSQFKNSKGHEDPLQCLYFANLEQFFNLPRRLKLALQAGLGLQMRSIPETVFKLNL